MCVRLFLFKETFGVINRSIGILIRGILRALDLLFKGLSHSVNLLNLMRMDRHGRCSQLIRGIEKPALVIALHVRLQIVCALIPMVDCHFNVCLLVSGPLGLP